MRTNPFMHACAVACYWSIFDFSVTFPLIMFKQGDIILCGVAQYGPGVFIVKYLRFHVDSMLELLVGGKCQQAGGPFCGFGQKDNTLFAFTQLESLLENQMLISSIHERLSANS